MTLTLGQALAGTPFDAARPAVFIWEAVTQYLAEAAVRQTLDFVGHSAPGSVLIFTYVLKAIIERRSGFPGADKLMDFTARGAPFIFGLEPAEVPAFIRPYHLQLLADVGPEYYQEHYLKPIGRKLEVSEIERVVTAQVVAG